MTETIYYSDDRGGTRCGDERRKETMNGFSPDRRSGRDRRDGIDRRSRLSKDRKIERRGFYIESVLSNCSQ